MRRKVLWLVVQAAMLVPLLSESIRLCLSLRARSADSRRLALREPTLIADLLKAGFSEPFPETAPSEAELVHMMNGWMAQHPDRNPPWSSTLNRRVLGRDFSYSVAISLTSTSEEIFTSVRQLGSSRMTYTLMDNDGACMIGRPVAGNGTYKRAYYGWLGGDLGFTSKPFVSSDWLRSQDLASETVSSRNEQSIVMANQGEPRLPFDHKDNTKK